MSSGSKEISAARLSLVERRKQCPPPFAVLHLSAFHLQKLTTRADRTLLQMMDHDLESLSDGGGPTPEENFPETEDACRNARDVSECEALVALHESKDEASVAKALAQGELPEADIDTTAQTEPELSVCV